MNMTLDEYRNLSEAQRMTFAASHALAAASGRRLLLPGSETDAPASPDVLGSSAAAALSKARTAARVAVKGAIVDTGSEGTITVTFQEGEEGWMIFGTQPDPEKSLLPQDRK